MLSKKLEDALNEQINAELWSGYLYLAMAMNFEAEGRAGLANWFRIQFKEEQAHAEIFINYVNQRGGRVVLKPIAEVPEKWDCPVCAFEDTLAHEQKVTAMINNLYSMAQEEKDYGTMERLNWFVAEQLEEEETAQQWLDKFKLVGDNGMGIYMLDQELGSRTYTAPAPLAGE